MASKFVQILESLIEAR